MGGHRIKIIGSEQVQKLTVYNPERGHIKRAKTGT